MSKLTVIIRSDFNILPHTNADRLELLEIGGQGGFVSVVGKGQFKPGDKVVYIPIDAILPANIIENLQKNSKITIHSRVRTAKIRGVISQGLCLKPEEWLPKDKIEDNVDVTELLGIKKFEPPVPALKSSGAGVNIWYQNDNFHKYTDIEHFRKFPSVISEGTEVAITIKAHGTNHRCGIVKKPDFDDRSWPYKLARLFGVTIGREFLVGSHNTIRKIKRVIGEPDTYWRVAKKYNLESICRSFLKAHKDASEIVLYGEVVGPGIQKGYDYGVPSNDLELQVFDIQINGRYQGWDFVVEFCKQYGLSTVSLVYLGPFSLDKLALAEATDSYGGKAHHREGIVIKPVVESWHTSLGRVILKHINPQFLLDPSNSDFH